VDKIAPRLQQSVDPAATAVALGELGALQSKLANHATLRCSTTSARRRCGTRPATPLEKRERGSPSATRDAR
jgi:hypothetical protein